MRRSSANGSEQRHMRRWMFCRPNTRNLVGPVTNRLGQTWVIRCFLSTSLQSSRNCESISSQARNRKLTVSLRDWVYVWHSMILREFKFASVVTLAWDKSFNLSWFSFRLKSRFFLQVERFLHFKGNRSYKCDRQKSNPILSCACWAKIYICK